MHVEILSKLIKSGQVIGLSELVMLLDAPLSLLAPGIPVVVEPRPAPEVLPKTLLWGRLFKCNDRVCVGPHGWKVTGTIGVSGSPISYVIWYCTLDACTPAIAAWHIGAGQSGGALTWDWIAPGEQLEQGAKIACTTYEQFKSVTDRRNTERSLVLPYKMYGVLEESDGWLRMRATVSAPGFSEFSAVVFIAVWGDRLGIIPQALSEPYLPLSWPKNCRSYMYLERDFAPPGEELEQRQEQNSGDGGEEEPEDWSGDGEGADEDEGGEEED